MTGEHIRFEYLGNTPTSDIPIVSIVIFSIIFHWLFFYFLPSSLTPLNKSYVVSTCHAIICVSSVVNFFARYSVNLKQANRIAGGGVYGTGDEVMTYSICYSLGYFIYDLLLMIFIKSVGTSSAIIHHIVVVMGASLGIVYRIGHPCYFYLLGEELSTISLNLKAIYHNRPRLHQMFTYLFVFSFFLCRIIYGTIICGYTFRAAPQFIRLTLYIGDFKNLFVGFLQVVVCILTRILNFYWANLILQKLLHLKQSTKKDS